MNQHWSPFEYILQGICTKNKRIASLVAGYPVSLSTPNAGTESAFSFSWGKAWLTIILVGPLRKNIKHSRNGPFPCYLHKIHLKEKLSLIHLKEKLSLVSRSHVKSNSIGAHLSQPLINLTPFIVISPPWHGTMPSFDAHWSFTHCCIRYHTKQDKLLLK